MPVNSTNEMLGLIGAFIVSIVSGTISIGQRILRGQAPSFLWVFTEFLTAILCGYVMYHTYPSIDHLLPEWTTQIMWVALASHSGGRIIQELEKTLIARFTSNSNS